MKNTQREISHVPSLAPRRMVALTVTLAAVVASVAAGCTPGESKAHPHPTTTDSSPASSPSPAVRYGAKGFDLCAAVSLEHLGDLAATTDKIEPRSAHGTSEQVECIFRMRSANDENVVLRVVATAHSSTEKATTSFTEGRDSEATAKMRDDGDVEGVGDEAYGKSRDRPGFSTKLLLARAENLVAYVYLGVQSEKTTPRSTLARMTTAVAKDVIDKAPRR